MPPACERRTESFRAAIVSLDSLTLLLERYSVVILPVPVVAEQAGRRVRQAQSQLEQLELE